MARLHRRMRRAKIAIIAVGASFASGAAVEEAVEDFAVEQFIARLRDDLLRLVLPGHANVLSKAK